MRKIIVHGSFIVLLGLGTASLAFAQTAPVPSDNVQVQDVSKEVRGDRLDRREAKDRGRDHRDDAKEPKRESSDGKAETHDKRR
jgi:hypothetical protein